MSQIYKASTGGGGTNIQIIDGDVGSVSGTEVEITGGSTGMIFTGVTATLTMSGTLNPAHGGTGVSSPTAHTLPVAEGSSNFNFLGPLTNGQLLIGSTGADPVAASLTAGTGISITPGSGSITIASTVTSGITTLGGDSGSVTGGTVTLTAGTTGLTFAGSGATMTMSGTLAVKNGGTSTNSFTAYMPICGGTATQSALQSVGTGTAGYVLTYNTSSSLPTWQAPSSGAMVLIETKTPAFGAIRFDSIPQTYTHLKIIGTVRSDYNSVLSNLALWFNFDGTGGNYVSQTATANSTTASGFFNDTFNSFYFFSIPSLTATAGVAAPVNLTIPNYTNTTFWKTIAGNGGFAQDVTYAYAEDFTGTWKSTDALNGLYFFDINGGNFITGSTLSLYGIA